MNSWSFIQEKGETTGGERSFTMVASLIDVVIEVRESEFRAAQWFKSWDRLCGRQCAPNVALYCYKIKAELCICVCVSSPYNAVRFPSNPHVASTLRQLCRLWISQWIVNQESNQNHTFGLNELQIWVHSATPWNYFLRKELIIPKYCESLIPCHCRHIMEGGALPHPLKRKIWVKFVVKLKLLIEIPSTVQDYLKKV